VKKFLVLCFLSTAIFAEDVMVERMQSVVDEVVDLRARYEASDKQLSECVNELQSQEQMVKKLSRGEGLDFKEYEQNREKIQTLEKENKSLKNYEKEIQTLEKENQRLTSSARILVDKNQKLLKQVNRYKQTTNGETEALEIELQTTLELLNIKKAQNKKLEVEINRLKTKPCPQCAPCKKSVVNIVKVIEKSCEDENPFPKLMPKDKKVVKPHKVEENHTIQEVKVSDPAKKIVSEKASVYRIKNEASVYDAINGNVVAIWEKKTSFTSNVIQGEWIKITGYFVDKKWKRAQKELWVKAFFTTKR
jgi:myosin heavy subunit